MKFAKWSQKYITRSQILGLKAARMLNIIPSDITIFACKTKPRYSILLVNFKLETLLWLYGKEWMINMIN